MTFLFPVIIQNGRQTLLDTATLQEWMVILSHWNKISYINVYQTLFLANLFQWSHNKNVRSMDTWTVGDDLFSLKQGQ